MLASDSACPQLASPGERARRPLHSHSMQKLRIDVWSDIVCPWCYVGKRRLEAALAQFPHRDAVEVVWRAFELDRRRRPCATKVSGMPSVLPGSTAPR